MSAFAAVLLSTFLAAAVGLPLVIGAGKVKKEMNEDFEKEDNGGK